MARLSRAARSVSPGSASLLSSRRFLGRVARVAAGCSLALAVASCSKGDAQPSARWVEPRPPPRATMVTPTSTAPSESQVCLVRAVSVEPPVPQPQASLGFVDTFGAPAVSFSEASKPPRVTKMALESTALSEAPDMKPEGPLLEAALREGGRASMRVTIPAGACVTYIAQGGLGVVELDAFLTEAADNPPPRILVEDTNEGPIAVIGGRAGCFRSPAAEGAPFAGELHVRARRGSGLVLVQGYQR